MDGYIKSSMSERGLVELAPLTHFAPLIIPSRTAGDPDYLLETLIGPVVAHKAAQAIEPTR
jgi:hypothetical protein